MFRSLIPAAIAALIGIPAFAQTAQPVTDPAQFAEQAVSGNMFEIESSRYVLDRLPQGDTATFAQQMIDDHTAAGEKMMTAAQSDGVQVPDKMKAAHQAQLDRLRQAEGPQLEEAYVAAQIAAHDEAVALFSGFSLAGTNSALKTFATETLPTLQMHQQMASGLQGS